MPITIEDKDFGWKKINEELQKANNSFVKIGVLSDAGAYSKTGHANLADVAYWNEYGVEGRIPSRPFMRQAFDTNRSLVDKFIGNTILKLMKGKEDARRFLEIIGIWYTGKVKEIFTKGEFESNRPFTVKMKGSSRPLIDTGHLRQSITHKVEMK